MNKFCLNDDDYFAIEIAQNVVRRLLAEPNISSSQILTLGKALAYLEKLPKQTSDTFIEFGISYRNGNEDFEEGRYIQFGLYDEYLEISSGGSVYDKRIGGDTIPSKSYRIEFNGCVDDELTLYDLEETINEYLNLGAEVKIFEE